MQLGQATAMACQFPVVTPVSIRRNRSGRTNAATRTTSALRSTSAFAKQRKSEIKCYENLPRFENKFECGHRRQDKNLSRQNLSFDFVETISVLSASADRPKESIFTDHAVMQAVMSCASQAMMSVTF